MGLGHPHETNHGEKCRPKHSALSSCLELERTNSNPYEQNHSKKTKYLPLLWNMGFDAFAFAMTTVVNEVENEGINRGIYAVAEGRAIGHTRGNLVLCGAAGWSCGRCFS